MPVKQNRETVGTGNFQCGGAMAEGLRMKHLSI